MHTPLHRRNASRIVWAIIRAEGCDGAGASPPQGRLAAAPARTRGVAAAVLCLPGRPRLQQQLHRLLAAALRRLQWVAGGRQV